MLTVLEKADLLQGADFFCQVRTRSLARISAIAQEVRYEAKQRLFTENENPDTLFVILDGEVSLTRNGSTERKLTRCQCAGALAVFGNYPQPETAVCSTPTWILRLHRESLFEAMAEDFNITRGILRALVQMVKP